MTYDTPCLESFEWDVPPFTSIELTAAQIIQAATLSQTITDPEQQWQGYLNALGYLGLQEWLAERAPDLSIPTQPFTNTSIQTLRVDTRVDGRVATSNLGLIVNGSFNDETICVPSSVQKYVAKSTDFYVLINVWEEQGEVQVYGYLPQPQLMQELQRLRLNPDQTYDLALNRFIPDPDALLLQLRRVPVPVTTPSPVVNTALWLGDRLDQLAQELAWVLMPSFKPAVSPFLAPVAVFDTIAAALETKGVIIPSEAGRAYRDFRLGNADIRLYALSWALRTPTNPPEWTLLIILGSQPGTSLPGGIQLQIQDDTQLLTEQTLEADCLFAQVEGTWEETFRVTIITPHHLSVTLPPFSFKPQ